MNSELGVCLLVVLTMMQIKNKRGSKVQKPGKGDIMQPFSIILHSRSIQDRPRTWLLDRSHQLLDAVDPVCTSVRC